MATKCSCIREPNVVGVVLRDPTCPATAQHEAADARLVAGR